jgi:alanine-synthesizing transaminase
VAIAREHGLVIFADEVYDKVLYDGVKHTAIASLSTDVLTLTFNSLSKSYRSCGYRAGWLVVSGDKRAAQDYIEGLNMLSNMRLCANVPGQWAIQTALGGYQSINDLVCDGGRLRRQRDLAYELITAIPGRELRQAQRRALHVPQARPRGLPDRGRPPVLPRAAEGNPRDAGAGHRLQLGHARPLPHRVPAP